MVLRWQTSPSDFSVEVPQMDVVSDHEAPQSDVMNLRRSVEKDAQSTFTDAYWKVKRYIHACILTTLNCK